MFDSILTKIIGTKNERELKRLAPYAKEVSELEPEISGLSDGELKRKTGKFKEKLDQGAMLEDILVEVFAVVREVAKRTLNMRHFDVQIMGGVVLHEGKIAEMATGEGKTLVATLSAYLNALLGKGVHIVTVNDYLARRDADWMGPIYHFLGLSVGVIQTGMDEGERKKAYAADITYGTNNEFGFDYLRDNMKYDLADYVQRGHHYAIVDEVDSILIDEARTPLIISGPAEKSGHLFYQASRLTPKLNKLIHYEVDEKHHTATFTEEGIHRAEEILGIENLYDPRYFDLLHALYQALKAQSLFKRDRDYIVSDGKVVIVDEFTGRLMPGRRYSDGLHQALEAKEGVKIEEEYQTLATITFQNYFRMYDKLAGMTGTAATEAIEFEKIYKLEVVVIPTNKPLRRDEHPDVIYRTEGEKFKAVVDEIEQRHQKEVAVDGNRYRGQPMLVGTVSIEKSEKLSRMLTKRKVKHVVLNAKHHEREAEIVAKAGQAEAVTISTNMAGRGTDIVLGDGVVQLGGLHVIGTERHEARRIDNQLRGRAGRQGDPGSSQFFLSLEDDLLRLFGMDRLQGILGRLGMKEGVPIEHNAVTRTIERAQRQVEGHNFEIRKHLLEYDDVMNKQRITIYSLRRDILSGRSQRDYVLGLAEDIIDWLMDTYTKEDKDPRDWEVAEFKRQVVHYLGLSLDDVDFETANFPELKDWLLRRITGKYDTKVEKYGADLWRLHERLVMLQVVDSKWKDHLYAMDHLKEGVGLRGYAQRDPLIEYKREAYDMFQEMMERIEDEITRYLFLMEPAIEAEERRVFDTSKLVYGAKGGEEAKMKPVKRAGKKVGRNDPCPCGSGKKYKKCCYLKGITYD